MTIIEAPHTWIKKDLTGLDKFKSIVYGGRGHGVPNGTFLSDMISLKKIILLCWECNHKFYPHYKAERYRLEPKKANATCDLCHRPSESISMYVPDECWTTVHAGHPDDDPEVRRLRYQAIPVRNLHKEDRDFLREKFSLKK